MPRKRVPICNKCGQPHYNMHGCGTPEAFGYTIQPVRTQLRRPRISEEDGRVLDFGDRTDMVAQADGRLVGYARKPMHEMTA